MFVFGSGVLIGTQLNVPTSTPINFGLVQEGQRQHICRHEGTLRPI